MTLKFANKISNVIPGKLARPGIQDRFVSRVAKVELSGSLDCRFRGNDT
jgi:hypothetical protein